MKSYHRSHRLTRLIAAGSVMTALILSACGTLPSVSVPKQSAPTGSQSSSTPSTSSSSTPTSLKGLGGALSVIIENLPGARPLSGLSHADMVFEAPAEGGITRFLALYWQHPVAKIGPVRSTRIYFDQLARAYSLPFAHAGGNVDALHAIGPMHIKNLDQIYGSGPYFWRSASRVAPHNLYTSTKLLLKGVKDKHYTLAPIPSWPTGQIASGVKARTITVNFSAVETVNWVYKNGMYTREEGQTIEKTLPGNEIKARSVLVLFTPESPDHDPSTPYSIKLQLTGSGHGYLAADGLLKKIDWQRQSGKPFTITTPGGAPEAMPKAPLFVELLPFSHGLKWSS